MKKNKRYNKPELEEKLNAIAEKVVTRGIYVVAKNLDSFVIQEYISKKDVLTNIPVLKTAEKICDIYNKKKKLPVELSIRLRELSSHYYKLSNDILHFKTCISKTKDSEILTILYARMSDSVCKLNSIKSQLERF